MNSNGYGNEYQLKILSIQKLKKKCKSLKLSTEGSKMDMIKRIMDKKNNNKPTSNKKNKKKKNAQTKSNKKDKKKKRKNTLPKKNKKSKLKVIVPVSRETLLISGYIRGSLLMPQSIISMIVNQYKSIVLIKCRHCSKNAMTNHDFKKFKYFWVCPGCINNVDPACGHIPDCFYNGISYCGPCGPGTP